MSLLCNHIKGILTDLLTDLFRFVFRHNSKSPDVTALLHFVPALSPETTNRYMEVKCSSQHG